MRETAYGFDRFVPAQDTAEKIGHIVTRSIEGLLFESKRDADEVIVPGVYYGTSRGVKYEYWARPGSSNLSYGPVDAGAHRMRPIARGAVIEGTGLTHEGIMTALMDHDTSLKAVAAAKIMIGQLGLTDVREQFKELVNNPYVEAMAA